MAPEACCTCASLLGAVPRVSASSEKPLPDHRQLDCCGRIICGACIHTNPRFLAYCPYCQTSGRSPLSSRPRNRPRREKESESELDTETESNPPPYSAVAVAAAVDTTTPTPRNNNNNNNHNPPPPPYTQHQYPSPPKTSPSSKTTPQTPPNPPTPPGYTLHHLIHPPHPNPDTLPSLSLRYGIPARTLLTHNNIPPDAGYLLAARHTLLIPTASITTTTPDDGKTTPPSQSQTLSLSPSPVENEAERQRKVTLRRFMVACKEADYDAAVVYLEESGYDLDEAVGQYLEDADWERAHPLPLHEAKRGKGKGRRKGDGKAAGVGAAGGRMGWLKGLVK